MPPHASLAPIFRRVGFGAASLVVVFNALAFRHAWTFTHPGPQSAARFDPRRLSAFDRIRMIVTGIPLARPRNARNPRDIGLSFQTHIIPGEGSRPPLEAWFIPGMDATTVVVLFHGHGGTKSELLRHARRLHEMGPALMLVDFPGSGGSGDAAFTVGARESEDVTATTAYARRLTAARRVYLYGLSMGSVAILKSAANGTTVDGIILECPFDSLLTTVGHRFQTVGLPAFPAAHALLFWGGVQLGFNPFRHGALAYAPSVREPVLLMAGDRDPWVTPDETRHIFDALGGPKRLYMCTGVGHASCLSRDSSEWTTAVSAFLANPRQAGPASAAQ
jgi:alpha-beta hydrolase superfamily lysophospholipase